MALRSSARSGAGSTAGSAEHVEVEASDDLATLKQRIDLLIARKRRLEREQRSLDSRSLLEFLLMARTQKQEALSKVSGELAMLDRDIGRIKQRMEVEEVSLDIGQIQRESGTTVGNEGEPEVPVIQADLPRHAKRPLLMDDTGTSSSIATTAAAASTVIEDHLSLPSLAQEMQIQAALESKKALIQEHYSDLQTCYFEEGLDDALNAFGEKMSRISRFSHIRPVATLKLGDLAGSANIISSIEFDREAQVFATAGVSRKIRFYEFRDARNNNLDLHCPIREISCKSKLSCISWNPYIQSQICAADYEGLLTVYDASTGMPICALEEHEKRCWSVDFSTTDPTRLASGSDDCYVKLWSVKSRKSICTMDGKANICSVRFHPEKGHLLAFGSADHNVHLYDLRYASKPLDILKGHKKAVSYVRFADASSLVSASTDCTLKLWTLAGQNTDLPSASATNVRTYSGHLNEKNFVGLSVQGDLIACGSENNSVYVYHRDLSKPLATYRFPSSCPLTDSSLENEVQQFVSSVCWCPDSNILMAANSQGSIRVLEIV